MIVVSRINNVTRSEKCAKCWLIVYNNLLKERYLLKFKPIVLIVA